MAQNITVLYMAGCHLSRWQNGVFGHVRAQVTATLFVFTLVTPRGTTVQVGQRPKGHWDPCIFIQVSFKSWLTDKRLQTWLLPSSHTPPYYNLSPCVPACHVCCKPVLVLTSGCVLSRGLWGAIGGACGIICYGVNRLIDIHLVLRVQKQQWPPLQSSAPFFITPIMRTV